MPKRVFGKVDEYGGELVASRFWRLWFLPIIPLGSVWLSGSSDTAQPIRWHGRSILAAYLRTWAPILWLLSFSFDSSRAYTAAGIAVALCAWSWTWRMAHRRKAQLRADFDLVALGSQCPPRSLLPGELERLLTKKQAAFEARGGDRAIEDVARFGSDDLDELLAAYAVLRLTAARRQPAGPWNLAAERILDGRHDRAEDHEGVFRSRAVKILSREEVTAAVRDRAARRRASEIVEASRREKTLVQAVLWGWGAHLIGYAALGLLAWWGGAQLSDVRDPDQFEVITERRLRNTIGVGQREYRVDCEELRLVSASPFGGDDVYACKLGNRYLPVVSEDGEGIRRHGSGAMVRGRLMPRPVFRRASQPWEGAFRASKYEDLSAVVYLRTDVFSKVGQLTLALSYLLGAPLLLALWIRLRGQRFRSIAEAKQLLGAASATGR